MEIKFKELLFNITLNPRNKEFHTMIRNIGQSVKSSMQYVMDRNFQYDLPISAFAKLCGRSLSSFKRDFKSHFGTTPAKWLIDKRLSYAKTLLRSTELNVNQVCYESGFKK